MDILRRVALLIGPISACLIGFDAVAQSATAADTLHEQFPPSSIDSVAKADAALVATSGAKARAEKDYQSAAGECLRKVLVNTCLDGARAQRRKRLESIDAVELEANRYKRRDKADRVEADRAKREAERATKAPADTAERERSRAAYETRQAEAERNAADRAKSEAKRVGSVGKPHKPAVKLAQPSPSGADADQRAKNAAAYDQRVKAAKEHQLDLDRRVAEKTAERKRRADAKAAKDARAAAAAAANAASGSPSSAVRP